VRAFADELRKFDKHFHETDFKYIDSLKADKAFKDLKIFPVAELVFYGVPSDKGCQLLESVGGGTHLEPEKYHELMQKPNTVIVDVRNHYEAEIGRFIGQETAGGAKYVDPKMRKSTDFMGWLEKEETKKELEGKEVLMYCTGGVRCERASVLVKAQVCRRSLLPYNRSLLRYG
jgi:predicted sulfurtransferase